MKPNKLTPGANVMWEGSRMMLPEHVVEINRHNSEKNKKTLPQLDDQELEELSRRIGEAKLRGSPITITVFGETEDDEITGIVTRIDPLQGVVRIRTMGGEQHIPFQYIMKAENPGD